jgi:citrate lyase synthetase
MIFKLIKNLNYLFDPEKIFLYGSTINHNLFKESLTVKKIPNNVSFCEQLDNNLASAYALINDFENGIEY